MSVVFLPPLHLAGDKGLLSALLALMYPFYSPAPAQEPTIIPQENPMGNDSYISQQEAEFENRVYISPQNRSIENQPYIDSINFQDNSMEVLTSSKLLRKNMVSAGIVEPSYPNAAHHIVAENSSKAAVAQALLTSFGIDINGADNGVFLPTSIGVSNSEYHPSLHTDVYYQNVENDLLKATNRAEAIQTLKDIRTNLLNGTYPRGDYL